MALLSPFWRRFLPFRTILLGSEIVPAYFKFDKTNFKKKKTFVRPRFVPDLQWSRARVLPFEPCYLLDSHRALQSSTHIIRTHWSFSSNFQHFLDPAIDNISDQHHLKDFFCESYLPFYAIFKKLFLSNVYAFLYHRHRSGLET